MSDAPFGSALAALVRAPRTRWLAWVSASLAFTVALVFARIRHTGHQSFRFLLWNLFLAVLPFGATVVLRAASERRPSRATAITLLPLWALWFVFWPNAPYLVTDFVHFVPRRDVPQWFDLLLLLSCAHNGLMLGLGSLYDAERSLLAFAPKRRWLAVLVPGLAISAGAFGIFLGRFHRWNSWDLATRPLAVLADSLAILASPTTHRTAWLVTVSLSAFLTIAYCQFRALAAPSESPERKHPVASRS